MSTAFAHSGAILHDEMTGFTQVVNQLDEGSAGVTKDVVLVAADTTLDADVHHGKVIDIRTDAEVTITLPKAGSNDYPPVGFKCTIVNSVDNASGSKSFTVQTQDSVSKLVGTVNGVSVGNDKTKLEVAASGKAYEQELTLEAVHNGTAYYFKVSGTSVAAVTPA